MFQFLRLINDTFDALIQLHNCQLIGLLVPLTDLKEDFLKPFFILKSATSFVAA